MYLYWKASGRVKSLPTYDKMKTKEYRHLPTAPYIHSGNRVWKVMLDVLLALLPLVAVAYLARGTQALLAIGISVGSALITEFIFAWFLLDKRASLKDGTALITALLLAFTLSPATPWYVIAFGSSMAILFGKILWGGLGKNLFNPALVGREFMTAFFPVIMSSGTLWAMKGTGPVAPVALFGGWADNSLMQYLDSLLYKTSGAMGEYSALLLCGGGLFLLLRNRISWHIPVAMFVTFFLLLQLFADKRLVYSVGGLLLGTLFMATDMPSSPATPGGKLYYGMMIGVVVIICLLDNIRHEYMSYSILILNGFSRQINKVFAPAVWGYKTDLTSKGGQVFFLSLGILTVTLAVLSLHRFGLTHWIIYLYILFLIGRFTTSTLKKLNHIL